MSDSVVEEAKNWEEKGMNMFNKAYQKARVEYAKKVKYKMNWCHYLTIEMFKKMIHCFVCVFIISVLVMVWLVSKHDVHGTFDKSWDHTLDNYAAFLEKHPAYYGISFLGDKAGYNVTDNLKSWVRN